MTAMKSTADVFSEDLRRFINDEQWRFTSRMPDWPHEYLVRERVDRTLFERAVKHIRSNGYEGVFIHTQIRYYEEGDVVYWTIGAPVEETVIINRCRKGESLELRVRLQGGE
jgi:endo-alpha-1,4-polygalactosaminidase (GH114 family)